MVNGLKPLIVIAGPTASGKSALAMAVAERFAGEIVSCDSVAVYRGMDIGSAKAGPEDRRRVPHHGIDLLAPDESATAGDFARAARSAISSIAERNRLPIIAGGTGLYLRATLDGLAPSPPRDEVLREKLRFHAHRRGEGALHRLLARWDPAAAHAIHRNDVPKLVRSLEVAILWRRPQTAQWQEGRDPLSGFCVLQIGLNSPRAALYERINQRAGEMFGRGLLDETQALAAQYGSGCRALGALGYAQALAVIEGRQSLPAAIAEAQQGHRNYAKRQLTWFRRDPRLEWVEGFGDDPAVQQEVLRRVAQHLTNNSEEAAR